MTTRNTRLTKSATAALALTLAAGAGACSSSDGATGSGKMATQKGRIIAYVPCSDSPKPVGGATVTVGANTTTTAGDGTYSIQVPIGAPFSMVVTKTTDPTYTQLIEADDTVQGDYNRGDTKLIDTGTANLLSASLPSYDKTRGLLTIELVKTGSCADVGGTTVKVTPGNADAQTQYPASCITPVGNDAFTTDGVFPAAVVYNLASGSQTVTVTSPKCTQIPFPYTDPATGLTYDGTVTTQGGGVGTSFLRVFMK